jgi:hypothetical protein
LLVDVLTVFVGRFPANSDRSYAKLHLLRDKPATDAGR